jgi:hypothetical protein
MWMIAHSSMLWNNYFGIIRVVMVLNFVSSLLLLLIKRYVNTTLKEFLGFFDRGILYISWIIGEW